jgi:hypothetical protein
VKHVSLMGKLFHVTKENTELQQKVTYLSTRLEKTILSEIGFERCKKNDEKSAPKFVPSSSYHKEEESLKPTKTHYPSNPKPSFNPKRGVKRVSQKRKLLCACFVATLITWMSFASDVRELRGDMLSMPETHIVMSLLISCLVLILMFHLVFTLVLFLSSLKDLTIAHIVFVYERTTLSLDALVTATSSSW